MLEEPKITLPKSIITGFAILVFGFLFYFTPLSNIFKILFGLDFLTQTYLFYFTLISAGVLFIAPYVVAKRFYKLNKLQSK
jgi:hypothetical protein